MSNPPIKLDDEGEFNFQFDVSAHDHLRQDMLQLVKEATSDVVRKFTNKNVVNFMQFNYTCFLTEAIEDIIVLECDILDSNDINLSVECYVYTKAESRFVAKSFAVVGV